jgi:hypothetical protein
VSVDRVEDLAVTLELVDKILTGTTYTPNDLWVKRLPLGDPEARQIKDELKQRYPYNQGTHEVPVLKLYRKHLEDVLRDYRPPPEKAKYPSLLDAVNGLNPRADVKGHWAAHKEAAAKLQAAEESEDKLTKEILSLDEAHQKAREPELAAARARTAQAAAQARATTEEIGRDAELLAADASLTQGDKEQIARDGFFALSVCFRIELEALALIPIVAIQTIRALPTAPQDLSTKPHLKIGRQLWEFPMYLTGVKHALMRQADALEQMTNALAKALHTSLEKSPGFELTESVVDQIVGITLDSFRIDLHAGAEAFIYSSIGTSDRSSSDDGKTTYDYRGRQYKLDYRIHPIVLASARLDLALDWIRMPGVARLGFGYATDRVYSSGGSIQGGSLVDQLGVKGVASDAIDAGLDLLGVRTGVKIATFTSGTVHQVIATDVGQTVATAPLQLKFTQLDVGYDILWAIQDPGIHAILEELVVGGRYLRYSLPRILYELTDTSTVAGEQHFTFSRESPPQTVASTYYMAAVSGRFGVGEAPRWSPFLDVGLAGGAGPVSFFFLNPDGSRDTINTVSFVFNGSLAGGLRWRLLPRGVRLRLDLSAVYRGDMIYAVVNRSANANGQAVRTDFGSFDVFHGPSIALRGAF